MASRSDCEAGLLLLHLFFRFMQSLLREVAVGHEIIDFFFGAALKLAIQISGAVNLNVEDLGENFRGLDLPADAVAGRSGRHLGKFPKAVDHVCSADVDFGSETLS